MTGDEVNLAEEYVQEFQFEDTVSIKREVIATTSNGHTVQTAPVGTAAAVAVAAAAAAAAATGATTTTTTATSEDDGHGLPLSHQLPRLPGLPTMFQMPSPPHNLLTPPDHNEGYSSLQHHYHHQQHQSKLVVKSNNVILQYPNIPGTPPYTPPVSNSPSPQSAYLDHHQAQQYSHQLQQMHPKVPAAYDDMLWVPQMEVARRQEPLDLRPNCNGEGIAEVQNWNVMQQHTSVIAAGNGKRIFQAGYIHHRQQLIQNQSASYTGKDLIGGGSGASVGGPLSNGSLMSPVSIPSGRSTAGYLGGRSVSRNSLSSVEGGKEAVQIDDDTLVNLSVRDLNVRLKSLPKERVIEIKKLRRTLKNRGYAQSCRTKRVLIKNRLEQENHNLKAEINQLKEELALSEQTNQNLRRELQKLASIQEKNVYHKCEIISSSKNSIMENFNFSRRTTTTIQSDEYL